MKNGILPIGTVVFALATCVAPMAGAQTAAAAPATPKLAVIDVQKVVIESAAGKEVFARLKRLQEGKVEEGRKREKELKELEQKVADQKFSLAEDKLSALQKEYQQKAIDFKRFQDDADRELEEAQKKELREMEKKIMPVVNAIGREEKYTLLFNKFQSGLVYADEAIDITESVIRRFNAATAAAADAKAAEKPAEKPAEKAPEKAQPKPEPKKK
jgi:outer membrane protein